MLIAINEHRFANSSSAAKSHPKAKARSHTQKPLESSDWSLPNVSNTSATEWLSSVVKLKLQRTLRYALPLHDLELQCLLTNTILQNEYASILAKRVNEEKTKKSELRKRRASSMRK